MAEEWAFSSKYNSTARSGKGKMMYVPNLKTGLIFEAFSYIMLKVQKGF